MNSTEAENMDMDVIVGPPIGYVDMLNYETREALKKEQEDGTRKWSPLRPSSAGKCERELFYEYMMYQGKASYPIEVTEPDVTRLLNLGHHIETHVIKQFEQYLKMVDVKYRQQVLTFENISSLPITKTLEGSLDACFFSDKWKCVVDFKSKKDGFSSYRSTRWEETASKLADMPCVEQISNNAYYTADLPEFLNTLNDPFFEANFLQLNLYANSSFLKLRGIDHAAIIQYNKNTSQLREVRFKPSESVARMTLEKFQRVVDATEAGVADMAEQEHVLGSMKCAFCRFNQMCWGEGTDGKKAWYATMSPKDWPKDTCKLGDDGQKLDALVASLTPLTITISTKERTEAEILKLMAKNSVNKIRTNGGEVYEAKHLKSPKPHLELRRSKA
jgi:hypothetical protein